MEEERRDKRKNRVPRKPQLLHLVAKYDAEAVFAVWVTVSLEEGRVIERLIAPLHAIIRIDPQEAKK